MSMFSKARSEDILPLEKRPEDQADTLVFSSLAKHYQSLLFLVAAMALFKTWEELFVVGPALPLPATPFDATMLHQAYFATKAAAFLACVFLSRRIRVLHTRKAAYVLIGLLMTAATALMLAACLSGGPDTAPLIALATIAGGIGLGLITLMWFELCQIFEPTLSLLCYLVASFISPLIMVAFYNAPFEALALCGLVFPLLSLFCCSQGFSHAPNVTEKPRKAREVPSYWKIIALVAVFGFTFGLREPLLDRTPFASGSLTAIGSLSVYVIVLLGLMLKGPRFNMVALFRVALPLTAIAFMLFPTDVGVMKVISDFCSSASYDLATLLAILVLANLCYFYSLPAMRLIGLMFGIRTVCIVLGWDLWGLFELTGMDTESIGACSSIISAIAISLTILLLPDQKALEKWGVASEGSRDEEASEDERLEHAVYLFGKRYGLTSREEDVLTLIAKGRTGSEIEHELFIAKGTLKTHRRNIYAKCNVHSRDELLELLMPEQE